VPGLLDHPAAHILCTLQPYGSLHKMHLYFYIRLRGSKEQKMPTCSLGAVYTRVFCIRYPVRDGATAQLLPLLFSRNHVSDRTKENVGRWRHHGRRNGRKKRECRRPFTHSESLCVDEPPCCRVPERFQVTDVRRLGISVYSWEQFIVLFKDTLLNTSLSKSNPAYSSSTSSSTSSFSSSSSSSSCSSFPSCVVLSGVAAFAAFTAFTAFTTLFPALFDDFVSSSSSPFWDGIHQ
jgi:hypothetical protein